MPRGGGRRFVRRWRWARGGEWDEVAAARVAGADSRRGREGNCVCPKCGKTVPHQRGVPCLQVTCPDCGTAMTRQP